MIRFWRLFSTCLYLLYCVSARRKKHEGASENVISSGSYLSWEILNFFQTAILISSFGTVCKVYLFDPLESDATFSRFVP